MWITKNSLAKRIEHKNKQTFEKVLTNKNKRSIIVIVERYRQVSKRKDLLNIIQTGWRTSDIGQVFIHTHKFIDQNGREFDIAETMHIYYYIFQCK